MPKLARTTNSTIMGASILLGKLNLFATPIKSDTISKNKDKAKNEQFAFFDK
ncbi:hypothetical protein HMSSN036_20860 [Paenibacillus macerans]|nr:hypothetical protein HMSSN036_20860 [Paenibacillus macerans]